MNDPLPDEFRENEAPAEPSSPGPSSRSHGDQALPEELLSTYLDLESVADSPEHFVETPENLQLRRHVEQWLAESSTNRQILHDLRAIRRELQALPVQSLDVQFSDRVLAAIRRKANEAPPETDEPSLPVAASTRVYRPTPKIPPMPAWRWFAAGVASTLAVVLLMAQVPGGGTAFLPSRTIAMHTDSPADYEVALHDAAPETRSVAPALPMAAPAGRYESASSSGPHDAIADAPSAGTGPVIAAGGGFAGSKDANTLGDDAESAAGAIEKQLQHVQRRDQFAEKSAVAEPDSQPVADQPRALNRQLATNQSSDGAQPRSAGEVAPIEVLADSLMELERRNEPAILEIHVAVHDPNRGALLITQAMHGIDHLPWALAASSPSPSSTLGRGMKSQLAVKKQNVADIDRAADSKSNEAFATQVAPAPSAPAVVDNSADDASSDKPADDVQFADKRAGDTNSKEKAPLLASRGAPEAEDNASISGESSGARPMAATVSKPAAESSVGGEPIAITAIEVVASPEQLQGMLAVFDNAALGNSIVSSQLTATTDGTSPSSEAPELPATAPAANIPPPFARNSARSPSGGAVENRSRSMGAAELPPGAPSGFGGAGGGVGSVSSPPLMARSERKSARVGRSSDPGSEVGSARYAGGDASQPLAKSSNVTGKESELDDAAASSASHATPRYRVRLVFVPIMPTPPEPSKADQPHE